MTALPEARLAREAEICYAIMGAITDYDAWRLTEADVTVEAIVANLSHTATSARRALATLLARDLPVDRTCPCASSLNGAIITDPSKISEEKKRALHVIAGRYWSP